MKPVAVDAAEDEVDVEEPDEDELLDVEVPATEEDTAEVGVVTTERADPTHALKLYVVGLSV